MEVMPFNESAGCLCKVTEGRQGVQAEIQTGSRCDCSCLGHFLVIGFFSSIGQQSEVKMEKRSEGMTRDERNRGYANI